MDLGGLGHGRQACSVEDGRITAREVRAEVFDKVGSLRLPPEAEEGVASRILGKRLAWEQSNASEQRE